MAGTLSWPTQPELNFAHELAGRVKVIACLDQQPILLHSEKWPDYAASKDELRRLKKKTGCEPEDALVVVWGVEQDTRCAAEEIRARYADATQGVPHETRQPFSDGSTLFERILPGPDRMYPDTDSPPQRVLRDRVARLQAGLPEPPWSREQRYREAGVPLSTVHYLIRRQGARLVDKVVSQTGAHLKDVCMFFGERAKGLRRKGVPIDAIDDAKWCDLFQAMKRNAAWADAWERLTTLLARSPESGVDDLIQHCHLMQAPDGWEDEVREMAATAAMDHPDGSREQRHRFLMGLAMERLRGLVPAQVVASTLGAAMEVQA